MARAATGAPLRQKWIPFYQRHEGFVLLLVLFVVFRLLAIWLMRSGGFVADWSDYDYYADWAMQTARGYETFVDMWTPYPPLFARMMVAAWELSARIPPWIEPRLAFHVVFGTLVLLFETGNLILIYRLAGKLARDEEPAAPARPAGAIAVPLHPALLYALLFSPVHTLLGWFDAIPLFFLLLGLDLLLTPRRWAWAGSALALALGFLVKLTPIVLLPVALRVLGARLSWPAARDEWFNRRSPGNLLRPLLYTLLCAGAIAGIGYWLVGGNLALGLSSFRANTIRPPWQNVWALLDGYYGFGMVPLDLRNVEGLNRRLWESRLPWGWITAAFGALYLWLYTRRYDWKRVRTVFAFTGVSVIWMLLYLKGWSPQFVVNVLVFVVLLLPGLRGIMAVSMLTIINMVESYVFMTLLPDQRWILTGTVILRTLLLIALALEFLAQIWPATTERPRPTTFARVARALTWSLLALSIVVGVGATPRMASAYGERRLAELPCREAVAFLRGEATAPGGQLNRTVVMTEIGLWQQLYPWLRTEYTLRAIDAYDPDDRPAAEVLSRRLDAYVRAERGLSEFWWIYTSAAPDPAPPSLAFFQDPAVVVTEGHELGDCFVERVVLLDETPALVTAQVEGGPILLRRAATGAPAVGEPLPLVLYWQAQAEVAQSYTVFTQLLDANGALVAQQDNLPVTGLAPTNTWEPESIIRDPYTLAVPEDALPPWRLLVGMYDAAGVRAPLLLADGSTADALELVLE